MAEPERASSESKMPAALSFYLRALSHQVLGGDSEPTPFTERDLSGPEIDALKAAVAHALAGDRPDVLRYDDYPTKLPWHQNGSGIFEEMAMIMNDPARSMMFSLGMAKINEGVITDQYDFGAPPELSTSTALGQIPNANASNNPRAMFNLIGNTLGLRSGTGRPVRIDLNAVAQ